MQESFDAGKRSLLSLICHACTLFGVTALPILGPIVILMISDDPVVKANAKESINFHINILFWAAVIGGVCGFIGFITLGLGWLFLWPIVAFGFLWHFGWSVVAILKTLSNPNEPFRYPFILRLL